MICLKRGTLEFRELVDLSSTITLATLYPDLMRRFALAHVLLIVVAISAAVGHAQDPLTAFPSNYKLILDNPQVRVLRCHYGPHEKVGVHNHSNFPTVYVYLSDAGEVRFTHVEEHAFVMTRPPVKAGAFRVSPGRPERHTVENLSDLPSDYLRIELKQIPLHGTLSPKRGDAPLNLDKTRIEVVFHDPQMMIERVICTASGPCAVPAAKSPSLLVAFSASTLAGAPKSQLQPGEILWIPGSGPLTVSTASTVPAQLLRINFPASGK